MVDRWVAQRAQLFVESEELLDRGYVKLAVSSTHLIGSAISGRALVGDDGGRMHRELEGKSVALLFAWPLHRIEEIEVSRPRQFFKYWDEELRITGGSSATRSVFLAGNVSYQGDDPQSSSGSSMLDFAELLLDAIDDVRPVTAEWQVKENVGGGGKGRTHRLGLA